ncbi:unnamed protein product [Phaedon cochleariae]|uniref:Uncharacterized protein n=1 Tax=Phaedon cochleariae TaxID=80249 RepID=A0A9P0DQS5_PHACE|nr:unnamed protein product [Phaedon cochleariae]
MSRPMNMLRTRRKDTNVKPNRSGFRFSRLDRKSSRGMIYENEDLRLKTININAEVESRQSDIKKLKRENEMLKKGLWYLRDEYDKLEKLVKDKKIGFSSSSTTCSTSSDSESCSSFSEASEEVETAQNMKNVQRTNMKNIHEHFDLLSVVTEETSAENSELPSNRTSLAYQETVLQPDQSYPDYQISRSHTLPALEKSPTHFFSPIQTSKSFDDNSFNHQIQGQLFPEEAYPEEPTQDIMYPGERAQDTLYPEELYRNGFGSASGNLPEDFQSRKIVRTDANCFYQNMVLVSKRLEPEIEVQAMEKSSSDLIVKLDNRDFGNSASRSTVSSGGNLEQLLNDIESISQRGSNEHAEFNGLSEGINTKTEILQDPSMKENGEDPTEKPFKSELNVVLMPNPMPLIGIDKYRNIQRSLESLNAKPLEELSVSNQNLCVIPPPKHLLDSPIIPNSAPAIGVHSGNHDPEANPFFFGNFKNNYVDSEQFGMKYGSDNFFRETHQKLDASRLEKNCGSRTNLIDIISPDQAFTENEENLKFKTTKTQNSDSEKPKEEAKSDKLSIRKKVCIHFKGKKDRSKKPFFNSDSSIPKTPDERKHPLWNSRDKIAPPETPSTESRKFVLEPKTTSSSDSKTSNDKKIGQLEKKDSGSDKKESGNEKKTTKSSSASPERKHVQLKEDVTVGGKKHRKHKRTTDRARLRRQSTLADQGRSFRERSYSVCTDRSNMLEHRLGFGSSLYFDEFSDDRERTNSQSSCETAENARKMSMMPNVPLSGKVPWCGCWGNGCL